MIIARIFGGLGNQLFCYAAAKSLAEHSGHSLVLDISSGFTKDFYRREPILNFFNIAYQPAKSWQSFQFPAGIQTIGALRKLATKNDWMHQYYYSERDGSRADAAFFDQPKRGFVYLDGYWQSDYYFKSIESVIRKEFQMKEIHDDENKAWAKEIQSRNAIAMHARRLHGVPNEKNAKPKPGVRSLSLAYYYQCMEELAVQVENPHFYCFSDYPEWFQQNLQSRYPITFVTHNQYGADRSHEDFWLMSQCKHFIISNSTFSWWAAWLSNYVNKKIFAPDLSFWECKDAIPRGWQIRNAS
ncbi:MAG: alpha-1,2-fucosyltransferase [Cytophagales bacterium]|jgi:hypothetical protein|nr:alpha-1,2-fucosyltransferase [Cytophagales bacterium]MCA6388650.1 alpha-1,2-fucosyltransferase [Cytophagales bacterium]MCA6393286.1 alpha-1,2-fucosyltransferase [Cytophagales bacterium]MCA6396868.1 alpha-1,2-fucosyltransferase [Cytophagales bacterium]MCA6398008.1 alpha-1,2-fucosyltransferase [Cytophagales bacterium]